MKTTPISLAGLILLGSAVLASGHRAADAGRKRRPTVKLLSSGHGPRRLLRYNIAPGSKEHVVTRMDMAMQMSGGPFSGTPKTILPSIEMTMSMVAAERVGKTAMRYRYTLDAVRAMDRPGSQPGMAAQVEKSLATMKGMRGEVVLSNRGVLRSASVHLPPGIAPQIKQSVESLQKSMEQMSAPLPVQKVGIGARWQLRQQIETGGMKLQQVTIYTLKRLDASSVTLSVELRQTAKKQLLTLPGMPASSGNKAYLNRLNGSGAGTMSLRFNRLAPTSKLTSTTAFDMTITAAGSTMAMNNNMELDITMTPK